MLDTLNDKVLEMVELELWKVVKIDSVTGELLLGLRQANPSNQVENVSNTNLEPELQVNIYISLLILICSVFLSLEPFIF